MKELYYKSANGTIINFIEKPYMMLSDTNLFNWEWNEVTTGQNFTHIVGFTNRMLAKDIELAVYGSSPENLYENIDHLVETVDADTRRLTMGRIYYGEYYIECYITKNEKGKFLNKRDTNIKLTVLVEDGDWRTEHPQIYSGVSGGENINNSCEPSVSSIVDWEYSPNDDGTTTVRWKSYDSRKDDIALNQDVFSPEYSPSHTPEMAVDGDYSTYFEIPANATDKSLVVTFDKVYHARNFILQHPQGITGDVRLYDYSTGERGFYFGKFNGTDPMTIDIEPTDVSAVEVVFESTNAVSVVEFVIYEDEEIDAEPTLTIDLGAVIDITTIGPLPVTLLDSGTLDISEDGTTWSTLDSSGSGSHTFYWHDVDGESARYIRLTSSRRIEVESNAFEIWQLVGDVYETNVARLSSDSVEGNATSDVIGGKKVINIGSRTTQGTYPSGKIILDLQDTFKVTKISDPSYAVDKRISYVKQGAGEENIKISYGDSLDSLTELQFTSTGGTTGAIYWSGIARGRYFVIETLGNIEVHCSDLEIIAEDTEIPQFSILNDNYIESDAIITIHGPTLSPSVTIGDTTYGVDGITLGADEYLVINTILENKTLRVYTEGDTNFTNVFPYRLANTFDKVGIGRNNLTWNGNLEVEIILKKNRSEPKWS